MCKFISILGAGPAGSSAAIAARREGAAVRLIEKSKFPRHKVCGEFFSPEIEASLKQLGAWDPFLAAAPARIRNMKLHFGRREKVSRLAEPAWGLSRYAFDALLLDHALALGAELDREPVADPTVVACGRNIADAQKGQRLFGFKAHFEGPADDAVELFFFDRCYVGVNSIEGGRTNVCGLGPEDALSRFNFDYDAVAAQSPSLAARLKPLQRSMKWLSTGPLRFSQNFQPAQSSYPAGDALSFVDPFTGTGLVAAVKTGALAGASAARATPVDDYLKACRSLLKQPFEVASLLRSAVSSGWADRLAGVIPSRMLFALTRPGK